MKPHPALTPLAGFNVRGVPVRIHVDTATPRRCTNHAPGTPKPWATEPFGGRKYCADCASSFAAYSRAKLGGDSVQRDEVSLRSTGGGIALLVEP